MGKRIFLHGTTIRWAVILALLSLIAFYDAHVSPPTHKVTPKSTWDPVLGEGGGLEAFFSSKKAVPKIPSLTGVASQKKPFQSFRQFYPHYFSEHQNPICRGLHVTGTLLVCLLLLLFYDEGSLLAAFLCSFIVGYILSQLLIGLDHGLIEFGWLSIRLIEFGVLIISFLAFNKAFGGNIRSAVILPLTGTHIFEKNKPATFIYPTFSLLGDFNMCFRILTGVESMDPNSLAGPNLREIFSAGN
ncbi:hypothetical protein AAMO2058_001393900 [Amorphochlora amoebiformis]